MIDLIYVNNIIVLISYGKNTYVWPYGLLFLPYILLKQEFKHQRIYLEEGKIVEITCEIKYWNQCDDKKIFIDDPYTLEKIKPNTEISIDFGGIVMVCTEVISNLSIKCKVIYGGYLKHGQFVCLRGVKLLKPALGKLDYHLLEFVKEYKVFHPFKFIANIFFINR